MKQVTKDMLIADILKVDEDIPAILMASGMGCVYCPASQGESLEEACFVHGMDADELLEAINDHLTQKAEEMAIDDSQILTDA